MKNKMKMIRKEQMIRFQPTTTGKIVFLSFFL